MEGTDQAQSDYLDQIINFLRSAFQSSFEGISSIKVVFVCFVNTISEKTNMPVYAILDVSAAPNTPKTGINTNPAINKMTRPNTEQNILYRIFPLPIK